MFQILSHLVSGTQTDLNIKPTAVLWMYSYVISAKYGINTLPYFFSDLIKEMLSRHEY